MAETKNSESFPAAYQRLRQRLAKTGWIALGSLLERDQPGQGGPRYQWSRRIGGKTITVALSAEQFAWLQGAIANQRELFADFGEIGHVFRKIFGQPFRA